MGIFQLTIATEEEMRHMGRHLAELISAGNVIYLHGELGVGKTTLARGILRALGYKGAVKSPTYALVETYHLKEFHLYHFDLYRLVEAEELEYMGMRDYFQSSAVCLVEWAENGKEFMPKADLDITLSYGEFEQRQMQFTSATLPGQQLLAELCTKIGLQSASITQH
ncbi:MAG TPA: tRNA (adenosine(37)-N6)-threonylcarbamoyltransferase complex ATPase subunit type 1 TsaE [Gammaproteobacteria bacterium]|nr:tRNA (adenosine(37)-N6)-threonylcarbamoyltransferase complex ATPase subunit type 1 TsaE [Gammaproteobacteria bacterium]